MSTQDQKLGALLCALGLAAILVILHDCTQGPPSPPPPPSTTTTTVAASPSPSPNACLPPNVDCDPAHGVTRQCFRGVEPAPTPIYLKVLKDTQAFIGDVCGNVPEESLEALAAELGDAQDSDCVGRIADAVFMKRPEKSPNGHDWFEQYHPVYYKNGCWIATPFRYVVEWVP